MELTLCLYLLDARYGMSAGSRPAGDQSMYSHSGRPDEQSQQVTHQQANIARSFVGQSKMLCQSILQHDSFHSGKSRVGPRIHSS